jgi:hypothetical protein
MFLLLGLAHAWEERIAVGAYPSGSSRSVMGWYALIISSAFPRTLYVLNYWRCQEVVPISFTDGYSATKDSLTPNAASVRNLYAASASSSLTIEAGSVTPPDRYLIVS